MMQSTSYSTPFATTPLRVILSTPWQSLVSDVSHEVDPETGQLLTGSLTDYCIARAEDLPAIEFAYNIVPCRTNPLGVKGAGEAGAIGAPPALVNAVVDALSELGIAHLDMPLTPERVWRTIEAAEQRKAA